MKKHKTCQNAVWIGIRPDYTYKEERGRESFTSDCEGGVLLSFDSSLPPSKLEEEWILKELLK